MKTQALHFLRNVDLETKEIIFIESDVNYSQFHLISGKKIIIAKTLKQITEIVKNTEFVRVNRQVLLNASYVKTIDNKGVRLHNGLSIAFSRRRIENAQNHISKYIF